MASTTGRRSPAPGSHWQGPGTAGALPSLQGPEADKMSPPHAPVADIMDCNHSGHTPASSEWPWPGSCDSGTQKSIWNPGWSTGQTSGHLALPRAPTLPFISMNQAPRRMTLENAKCVWRQPLTREPSTFNHGAPRRGRAESYLRLKMNGNPFKRFLPVPETHHMDR